MMSMNWFEDDDGHWWNLDLVRHVQPTEKGGCELTFDEHDDYTLNPGEWQRLKAQLLNSQRPADRRTQPEGTADERTSPSNGSDHPNSTPTK
jgi:hypothetical protein